MTAVSFVISFAPLFMGRVEKMGSNLHLFKGIGESGDDINDILSQSGSAK